MNKLLILYLVLFLINCNYKKQIEIQIWETNKKYYAQVFLQYPNFQPILELKIRQADSIWNSLVKETNYETQVQKMRLANQTLHSLLGYFTQIQNKIDILRKSIFKLSSYPKLENKLAEELNQIQKNLFDLETSLKEAQVTQENELKTLLVKVIQELDDEIDKIDEIFKKTKL